MPEAKGAGGVVAAEAGEVAGVVEAVALGVGLAIGNLTGNVPVGKTNR